MSAATHTKFGRANLNPAEWETLGVFYQGPSDDEAATYRGEQQWLEAALAKLGLTEDDVLFHDNFGCASCGTHFFHGAVVHNTITNDTIAIGGTCLGIFDLTSRSDMMKRKATQARKRGELKRKGEEFAAGVEGLVEALRTQHYIIESISGNLTKYGSLSDKQIDLVFKIAREEAEYAAKLEARQAELAKAPMLAEGRYQITGTVFSTKVVDDPYSYYGGGIVKMLVELDNGNRVFGTMPAAINVSKGDRVQFDAAVERSKDDDHFGFFKRPTKATQLETEETQ